MWNVQKVYVMRIMLILYYMSHSSGPLEDDFYLHRNLSQNGSHYRCNAYLF